MELTGMVTTREEFLYPDSLCGRLPEELQILLHLDTAVELAERFLPLFSLNLGWILPAVLGLLIGLLCQKHQKTLQAFA